MQVDHVKVLQGVAKINSPREQPKEDDWRKLEAEMELLFPSDYKRLVTVFGSGYFGVGLYLRNPVASSEYVRLSTKAIARHYEPILDLKESSNLSLYPEPSGAIIIGTIDQQDFLLRPKNGSKHLSELIWWRIDTGEVLEVGQSISKFIHDLFFGKVEEDWAVELRDYIWRIGTAPLFAQD